MFLDLLGGMLGLDGVWSSKAEIARGLAAACAAGQPLACSPGWWDPESTDGLSLPALARAAEPRCEAGDLDTCVALGLALTQATPGRPAPWLSTWAEGIRRLETAAPFSARACAELARALAYADPMHMPGPDEPEAAKAAFLDPAAVWASMDTRPAQYARQACEQGDAVGCLLVASSQDRGWWEERSDPAWQAACDAGSALACWKLHPEDPAAACARGVAAACAQAPAPDLDVLDRACWLRDGASCLALARRESSPALAWVMARRACADGEDAGCVFAGDMARAAAWADERAFLGDFAFGSLATRWRAWKEVGAVKLETDWALAGPALDLACASGDEGACIDLARLQLVGLGVEPDPTAARRKLVEVCEAGSARACREAMRLAVPGATQRWCSARREPYCAISPRRSWKAPAPPPGAALKPLPREEPDTRPLLPGYARKYGFGEASCTVRVMVDAAGHPRSADATDCHPMLRSAAERAAMGVTLRPEPGPAPTPFDLRYLFRQR